MRDDLYMVSVLVQYGYRGGGKHGWGAWLAWHDTRFAESGAVEGTIRTRYREATPADAIDAVTDIARQFGLRMPPHAVTLIGKTQSGESAPADALKALQAEADRRGWTFIMETDTPADPAGILR